MIPFGTVEICGGTPGKDRREIGFTGLNMRDRSWRSLYYLFYSFVGTMELTYVRIGDYYIPHLVMIF